VGVGPFLAGARGAKRRGGAARGRHLSLCFSVMTENFFWRGRGGGGGKKNRFRGEKTRAPGSRKKTQSGQGGCGGGGGGGRGGKLFAGGGPFSRRHLESNRRGERAAGGRRVRGRDRPPGFAFPWGGGDPGFWTGQVRDPWGKGTGPGRGPGHRVRILVWGVWMFPSPPRVPGGGFVAKSRIFSPAPAGKVFCFGLFSRIPCGRRSFDSAGGG